MKHAIGNNNQRRKPLDLTDRIMSEAKGYKKRTVKPQSTSNASKPINNEIEPHEYDVMGDIQLNLKPLNDAYVAFHSQLEYDCLMQVCQQGGLKWGSGKSPTSFNAYEEYGGGSIELKESIAYYGNYDVSIISSEEFYKTQKITPKIIEDINEWFEDNHAGRESKGDQK